MAATHRGHFILGRREGPAPDQLTGARPLTGNILAGTEPRKLILALGFPSDHAEIIHAFVGGSALHGVKLQGTGISKFVGELYVQHWATGRGFGQQSCWSVAGCD